MFGFGRDAKLREYRTLAAYARRILAEHKRDPIIAPLEFRTTLAFTLNSLDENSDGDDLPRGFESNIIQALRDGVEIIRRLRAREYHAEGRAFARREAFGELFDEAKRYVDLREDDPNPVLRSDFKSRDKKLSHLLPDLEEALSWFPTEESSLGCKLTRNEAVRILAAAKQIARGDKSAPSCPACGRHLATGAVFCDGCGARVKPLRCAKCDRELKPDAAFCDGCGARVEA